MDLNGKILFFIIIGYVVGSIPTGYLLAKYIKGVNIREFGSGNIGATNVKRVLGTWLGALTLMIDILKSYLVLWMAFKLNCELYGIYFTATAILLGNCFSIFLKGKGGKGVATSFGIYLALAPILAAVGAVVYGGGRWLSKISAVGSLAAHLFIPAVAYFKYDTLFFILTTAISLLIMLKHRPNIIELYIKFFKNNKI